MTLRISHSDEQRFIHRQEKLASTKQSAKTQVLETKQVSNPMSASAVIASTTRFEALLNHQEKLEKIPAQRLGKLAEYNNIALNEERENIRQLIGIDVHV